MHSVRTRSTRKNPLLPTLAVLTSLLLAGCSAAADSDPSESETNLTGTPQDSSTAGEDAVHDDAREDMGPVETYLAWLEASRIPEPEAACGYLTEELIERMLREFEAGYPGSGVDSCEEITELTAELYRAAGQGAEVDVQITEESETTATLFVTYIDTGECGTIVLHTTESGSWVINEMSEQCAEL